MKNIEARVDRYEKRRKKYVQPLISLGEKSFLGLQIGLILLFICWIIGSLSTAYAIFFTLATFITIILIPVIYVYLFGLWHRMERLYLCWLSYPIDISFKQYLRIQSYNSAVFSFYTTIVLAISVSILVSSYTTFSIIPILIVSGSIILFLALMTLITFNRAKSALKHQAELQNERMGKILGQSK